MNQTNVVAAIIKEKNKYLIVQRNKNKHLGLKYEFPGGKVHKNEDFEYSDEIRNKLFEIGISLSDDGDKTTYSIE